MAKGGATNLPIQVLKGPSPLVLQAAGGALSDTVGSVAHWLEVREHRKELEGQYRFEAQQLRAQVDALRIKVDGNVKYWKHQSSDNQSAREGVVQVISDFMENARSAIDAAVKVQAQGNPDLANKLVDTATKAIEACTETMKKFPAGPLATVE